ncbi:hypothetical protein Q8F57_027230 [Paraburkholderia terrae]|uniref:hypothetical protein n=1 Tax=Paraburkholderia terrae TaxID=311230 RepID=UPI00296B1B6F|nr:hypothetical protein [Paraburkholderia terrae]MDW3660311.1 hypothetical protein [Paraburkholderia terrae]
MASLAGLPYFMQYEQQARDEALRQQAARMQMAQFQQAQQDRQRQQAALAAAGNALPQLLGPQQQPQQQLPPPPQTPAPGQPSQPMQQAGGAAPLPGMGPAPGGVQPPLPAAGARGSAPAQGIPPFRPMPTSGSPAQAAPGAIPPPPSTSSAPQQPSGPLSLESAIKALQDQGLSGADLMTGLSQLTPILDAQAKVQSAQLQQHFTNELKLATLQQRKDEADQRAADRRESMDYRMQAHQDSLGIQREMFAFRVQQAKEKHAGDPDAKLDKETVDILAQQALAGDTSVYQNLGRGVQGAQNIVAIRKRVAELAKDQGKSGADIAAGNVAYGGEKAAARSTAVSSGKQAQAADEATQLADQALDVSKDFARTNAPSINAGLNALRKQGGDPQVAQFNVAINGFKNTYSRAISPTGTPTVHDKQHADELFSLDQSPAQFAASIAQAKKEMAAAIAAPGHVQAQQRARISGRPAASETPSIPSGWSVTEH